MVDISILRKPVIKWGLYVIGGLLALSAAVVLYAMLFLDPNDYKDDISSYVKSSTGRTLTIEGDLSWTLFPWFGINVNGLAIDNAVGFKPKNFAKVKSADLSIKALPLVFGKFKLGKVYLNEMHLNLVTNRAGKNNWSDFIGGDEKKKPDATTTGVEVPDKKAFDFNIKHVKVINSSLNWIDNSSNQDIRLTKLNFNGKNIGTASMYPMDLTFNMSVKQPKISGGFDLEVEKLTFSEVKGAPKARAGDMFPVKALRGMQGKGKFSAAPLSLNNVNINHMKGKFTLDNGLINISPINGSLYGGSYNGNVTLDVTGNTPQLSVNERMSGIEIGGLLKDMTGKPWVTGKSDLKIKLTGNGNTLPALKRTLRGNISYDNSGGEYGSMNIASSVTEATQLLASKDPRRKQTTVKSNKISKIHTTFDVNKGIARSNDILVDSPGMYVTGGGAANILSETLDFKLYVKIGGALGGTSAFDLAELLGGTIPVYVRGTFSNPRVEPDQGAILQAIAKKLLLKPVEDIIKAPTEGVKKLLPF